MKAKSALLIFIIACISGSIVGLFIPKIWYAIHNQEIIPDSIQSILTKTNDTPIILKGEDSYTYGTVQVDTCSIWYVWDNNYPLVFIYPFLESYLTLRKDGEETIELTGKKQAMSDAYMGWALCNQGETFPDSFGEGMLKISEALGFLPTPENLDKYFLGIIKESK